MPVGWFTATAIFLVVWWVVLFAVLPLGMDQKDREIPTDGAQWGAPADPQLKKKFLTTTWIAAVVWVLIMVILATSLIPLPDVG